MLKFKFTVAYYGFVLLVLVACGSNVPGLSSIEITPATSTLNKGDIQQFTATGTFSDGSIQNFTALSQWSSSDPSIVSISDSGLATAISWGTTTISASAKNIEGKASVSVPSNIHQIVISPFNSSWTVLCSEPTVQMTATGILSDNTMEDITSLVTWTSSDINTAVVDSTGLVTFKHLGQVTITASIISDLGTNISKNSTLMLALCEPPT
jgi:uncharacterized protein YjdB